MHNFSEYIIDPDAAVREREVCAICNIHDAVVVARAPFEADDTIGVCRECLSQIWSSDEDEGLDIEESEDGLIEVRGNLYCAACGLLAQPGNEEFDWCDHRTGNCCSNFPEDDYDDDFSDYDDYYDGPDESYDGLRLCSVCGDRETTDDVCWSCRQQQMIDNDPNF